jgi:hypothetical protein
MHDAIRVDPNVRVLEALDGLPTFDTTWKERVDRSRDRIEDRIVVTHVVARDA